MKRASKLVVGATAAGIAILGPSAASAADPAQPASGVAVYNRWCIHCHSSGRGNPGADSLQVKYGGKIPAVLMDRTDLSPEVVARFVRTGVLSMPPFRKTEITDSELASVAAYIAQKYVRP